jgi:serine/threonine protein kinase/WD40 repeat protein
MAASSAGRAESEASVRKLLEQWQDRAARGEPLEPEALLAELAQVSGAALPELPGTVELPVHQAATVSLHPRSDPPSHSPSRAFAGVSSRTSALFAGGQDGDPAASLADYELIREVARGGMGVVYEARQKSLNRIVALKMIRAGELADAEDVARFYSEAEAAANLRHPNIVAVYEVGRAGTDGEHHYFTMDFVAGPSLLEIVRKQPLDARTAAQYVARIARAIQFAHDRGVLHRDLKPANILIGDGGEPLVTDFGLAKRLGTDSGVTIAGTVLGTPSYMPPEQAAGKLSELGPHSDIYSLGAVLYECVTGRPPFVAADIMEVFRQVMQEEPLPPRRLSPKLPRDLETICLKCLAKDKQRRYHSAAALADDLERFLRNEPIAARPVGAIERAAKWSRRHPAWAAMYGVLAGAVVAVLGIAGFYNHQLSKSNTRLTKALSSANAARANATNSLRAELRNAYATKIQRTEDCWEQLPPNIAHARELLASLVPGENQEDLRGIEWHILAAMCDTDEQRVLGGGGAIKDLAVLPSGRLMAFHDTKGFPVLEWADPDGTTGRHVLRGSLSKTVMKLSSGSEWAVAASVGTGIELRSWHDPDRAIVELTSINDEPAEFAISPDGRRIAWCTPSGHYRVWSVADRRVEVERKLSSRYSIHTVCFSPDGEWLGLCGSREPFVLDLKTGRQSGFVTRRAASISAMAFSPDGTLVVLGQNDGQIELFKLPPKDDDRPDKTFNTLRLNVRPEVIQFLPAGGTLAIGASNGLVIFLDIERGNARMFRGHTERVVCLAVSPDGRWLYSGSSRGEVLKWDTSVTDQRATIVELPASDNGNLFAHHCLDYSPDGRWLAIGGKWMVFNGEPATGELAVLDAATRKIVRRIQTPEGVHACRFTLDSRQIVYGSARPLVAGRVWLADAGDLAAAREISVAGQNLFGAAPLAGGSIALAASDEAVRLWSPETGGLVGQWRPKATRRTGESEMFSVVSSPSGKHLLAHGEDGVVRMWDAASGRELLTAPANLGQEPLAVSSDGRLVVWPAANPELRRSLQEEGLPFPPEFPGLDEWEERAIVFDVRERKVRLIIAGHSAKLTALAFSPDSRRLAAGDSRGHLKLWDLETGHELLVLQAHLNDVFGIAFHPGGQQMATVGADGLVRIWPRKQQ